MTRRSWYTLIILAVMVVGIVALLLREAASGPTFRADDHATLQECIANIPVAWPRGSLEYTGAEAACQFAHQRRLEAGRASGG
jgi:hypothetical protein